jgi:hypothetical protein
VTEQAFPDKVVRVRYEPGHLVTCARRDLHDELRSAYDKTIPAFLRYFLDACGAGDTPTDGATVAYVGKEIVGAFRFNVDRTSLVPVLYAAGTWVDHSQRGKGVALRLWRVALRRHPEVREVSVASASRGGRGLTRSMARRYPALVWYLDGHELDEKGMDKER